MIERFIELASFVSPILLQDCKAPVMLTGAELKDLQELMLLLKPFEYVTREVSGENYITISKVIPLINCLSAKVASEQTNSPKCENAKRILLEQIHRRFGEMENNPILAVSTILDPRFKNLHFKIESACTRTMNLLRTTISETESQSTSSESDTDGGDYDFWKEHKQLAHRRERKDNGGVQDELSLYIKSPVTPLKSNPLDTWEDLREVFPGLYKEFRKHAMIVASSVPAERLFSKAGATITQKRNRLKPKRLNELLFLSGRPEEEWF